MKNKTLYMTLQNIYTITLYKQGIQELLMKEIFESYINSKDLGKEQNIPI